MRLLLAIAAALCVTSAARPQAAPPLAPDADLETIRDWAASRLSSQTGAFKDMLQRSIPILQSSLGDDTTVIRETIARLASRAAPHPQLVIAAMAGKAAPTLRRRLVEILVATGDPSIGAALLATPAEGDEEFGAALIQAVGRLQSKDVVPALIAKLDSTQSPAILGEIVIALARLDAKEALPAARRLADNPDPKARAAGATALGIVGSLSGKEDIEILKKLVNGPDPAVRAAGLKALGRFRGHLDALRLLHDSVILNDPIIVKAALEGLEAGGTKELTPHFLLQVVKSGPGEVRERAARLLLRFGNPEGIRQIVQPDRLEADQHPADRNKQVAAGDHCRELGWYEGAIPFYDRALSGKNGDVGDQQILVSLARCYARLKRFDDAKRKLSAAKYVSLRVFAEDPDFAEMKDSPSFRESFK